ncbi:MAG: 50S ribosomal protein L22 [Rhodothermia bacterium]|nr:MAG: 50S ribosomal protein L22 [Rhodothermia bacterium]
MEARAVRKHIKSSPRKLRPIVNIVRGKRVPDALDTLNFLPQKVTRLIKLTILSAVHNLMDKNRDERFDETELVVKEIRVDEGARLKRFRPVSRGRAHPIQKRTAHLTVVVAHQGPEDNLDGNPAIEEDE